MNRAYPADVTKLFNALSFLVNQSGNVAASLSRIAKIVGESEGATLAGLDALADGKIVRFSWHRERGNWMFHAWPIAPNSFLVLEPRLNNRPIRREHPGVNDATA